MQRKLPKLYGNRPIDAPSQRIHGINTQEPTMSRKEALEAICHPPLPAPTVNRASTQLMSK